jgi:RepB DNA-primase from phage plasmid
MDRTRHAVQRMMDALGCPAYEIGIKTDRMQNHPVAADKLLNLIPWLRYENTAHEAHIYIRPHGEHNRSFTLLDDLDPASVDRLYTEGFSPSALVETSPGNFQAWLKHSQPLEHRLATLAARILSDRFDADPSAAGWMRYGRLPGFTNRKMAYRREDGNYPFVLLRRSRPQPFPVATRFHMEITKHLELLDEQQALTRETMRRRFSHAKKREVRKRPLSHYRDLAKYHDDPKSADIAFCVFNLATGISEAELAADLESQYLSRNPDVRRRTAYIERSLRKAAAYVAS